MAIVQVPGGFTIFCPQIGNTNPALDTSSQAFIDSAGDRCAFVFQVPKSGTLDQIEFRIGNVISAVDLKVSLQSVDPATGNPDGVVDQYRVVPSASVVTNTWVAPGLITDDGTNGGVKRTVTRGEMLALVFEFDSSAGNINFTGLTTAQSPRGLCYMTRYNGVAWGKQGSFTPILAVKYDDGTYGTVNFGTSALPIKTLNAASFASNSTPDERGLRFSVPTSMEVSGVVLIADWDAAADVVLYDTDGTTVLATASLNPDVRVSTSPELTNLLFASPVTLTADEVYRLVVKPTSTSSVVLYDFEVNAAAMLAAAQGGEEWHYTERTDAGSWTETTTKRPWIGLLLSGIAASVVAGLVLTINNIERDIRLGTLQISKVANGVDTFACEIMSEDGSYRPAVDDVVRLELDGEALFAGVITQPDERALTVPGEDPITTRVTASDFNIYTTYAHVTETIPAGQTVKQVLETLEAYITPFGAALDPAQIDGPILAGIAWDDRPLHLCLDDVMILARDAGAELCWELNYDLELSAFDPTTRAAPFEIHPSTSPDHVVGDIEIERSHADGYADKVIVKATPRPVSNYTEQWIGDGYTTVFPLTVTTTEAQTRGLVTNNAVDETLSEPGGGGTWIFDASTTPQTITKDVGPPPGAGDLISLVVFTGSYSGRATAGTGLREVVVPVPDDLLLDAAGLQAFANAELAKRQVDLVRGRYLSHTAGLEPGQTQVVEEPTHDVDSEFIVAEVNIRDLAPSADDFGQPPVLEYALTVIEGAVPRGDWREFWRAA